MRIVLLGGAPKCGTSALFDVVSSLNNIVASSPKETYFFLPKNHPLRLAHFVDTRNIWNNMSDEDCFLEGTTHNLYHLDEVLCRTREEGFTEIRAIFVLRNPIDRLISSFLYTINNLAEFRESIELNEWVEALLEKNDTRIDEVLYDGVSKQIIKEDLDLGNYAKYLRGWITALGRHNVRIVDYDTLKKGDDKVILDLECWLGIKEKKIKRIQRKNKTENFRSFKLHRFVLLISPYFRNLYCFGLLKKLYLWLQRDSSRKPNIDPTVRKRLIDYYKPSIKQLEKLLDISFDKWLI